jgi:hypothetical protein
VTPEDWRALAYIMLSSDHGHSFQADIAASLMKERARLLEKAQASGSAGSTETVKP